jgi:hypothetical protein
LTGNTMSIARHHNEWLSLLEISGPFLSMPVLLCVFPQGLEALDREMLSELRQAYDEWLDDQNSLRPTPAIHTTWVRYVLGRVIGFEKVNLREGPAIPATLSTYVAEQGETLRPDLVSAPHPQPLSQGERGARMLIQTYPMAQGLEKTMQGRHWKASPAMRMLELLRATGVQLGLVTNGEQWMLVNAPRGETSAFISWYAALWLEEPLTLRAFCSLLGAPRFFSVADEDTLEGMLKASTNEQQEVTDQLGYQVRRAVEVLIRAVDKANQDRGHTLLKDIGESELYEAALTVMMRLVFLFSAEERGLLLLGDPLYDQNYAVSTLRAQLRETADQQGEEVLERRFDAWCRLLATFRAVHGGIHHDRLNLPAYGGSLFDPNRFPFLEGRSSESSEGDAEPLPISNRTVLHLLEALQILRVKVPGGGPAEPRRLSFRALDVEQIGHVYEGLLDHIAVRASEPVLGLVGTKDKEPEIPLSILQAEAGKGEKSFPAFLKEQTGRSENALRKAWQAEPEVFAAQNLQIACNNDPKIYAQVVKYASLIREDDFGFPSVFLPGSVYVSAGATRRATGTHYTPRSLTEPIVQHTLEPLVYIGPAEGLPKEQWKLHSPAELLELKICDMAMGSAGFLVQVIRYLSERLVEAWEGVEQGIRERGKGSETPGSFTLTPRVQITPEGKLSSGAPGETIIPRDDEERLILARRLVADRCIYGVDKNPLAVEIAKLSIWLTTMDKGRPFTFLDHALKCGDSLVGASEDDFMRWAHGWQAAEATLFDAELQKQIETAREKRRALEAFTVLDVRDAEQKVELLKEAEAALERVKVGCDLLVGARLLGLSPKETEDFQLNLLFPYMAGQENESISARRALTAVRQVRAFHWEFEFPEVFERGGFNAFVGNPPFIGGQRISGEHGVPYRDYLVTQVANGQRGSADLCAYFLLQAFSLLSNRGVFGLVATNTISQGDTREVGLDGITSRNGVIYRATTSTPWPGSAAVAVSTVYVRKGKVCGPKVLDEHIVETITSLLDSVDTKRNPYRLHTNIGKSFQGSNILGIGFLLSIEEAHVMITKDARNKDVLFPFLNGEDLNSDPLQSPSRWVINFFDWPLAKANNYPDCLVIVRNKVYPERQNNNDKNRRELWWRFTRPTLDLYKAIANLRRTIVAAQTSKYLSVSFQPIHYVFSHATIVISLESGADIAVLCSHFHEAWVRKYASTLETRLRYIPTDCFETFPFPPSPFPSGLDSIGENYHEFRRQIMLTRQEGLTATYNRFHNLKEKASDIARLRELHVEMDNAVAEAYDWSDLDLGHGFHETAQGVRYTISEEARREVLRRLLELNHERYEEEVRAGLHEAAGKGSGGKGRKVKETKGQGRLF